MKKTFLFTILVCIALAVNAFSGGAGSSSSPYLVSNADDLAEVSGSSYYKLTNDIDLTEWIAVNAPSQGWIPIANFNGVFDGANYTIKGLMINRNSDNVGLFGYCAYDECVIKNVSIINPQIKGGNYVGTIAGSADHIENCHVIGGSIEGTNYVGGIAGVLNTEDFALNDYNADESHSFAIKQSSASVNIFAVSHVGGIVGATHSSTYAHSWVGSIYRHTGSATVTNCYFNGRIVATGNSVGGIVGGNYMAAYLSPYGTFDYCKEIAYVTSNYARGSVTGISNVGGIVGNNCLNTEKNVCILDTLSAREASYRISKDAKGDNRAWNQTVIIQGRRDVAVDDSPAQGTSAVLSTLRRMATYENMGWDFYNIWDIQQGESFPYLFDQSAPLAKVTNFEAGTRATISGSATKNGFVGIIVRGVPYETQSIDGEWKITIGAIESGTPALYYFREKGLAPSYPQVATATSSSGILASSMDDEVKEYQWENVRIMHVISNGKVVKRKKYMIK